MDLLTLLLLISLPGPRLPPQADPVSWANIKSAAYLLDLWPLEGHWRADFGLELEWCREQHAEMRDCPPAEDVGRFPVSPELVAGALAFNAEFSQYLERRIVARGCMADDLTELQLDTGRRRAVWCAVSRLVAEHTRRGQRVALRELRGLLGETAYYAGQLPAWVDAGAFTRAR